MSTSEDLYEAMMDRGYASPREGVSNIGSCAGTEKDIKIFAEKKLPEEKIGATEGI